jgi:hypothetical protein
MNKGTAKASATVPSFVRPGFNNIAPYIVVNGAAKFIEFLEAAFQGTERLRMPRPDGAVMHAEIGIGNSVIELADASEQHPSRPTTVHLYVDDADAAYERSLRAGATRFTRWTTSSGATARDARKMRLVMFGTSQWPRPGILAPTECPACSPIFIFMVRRR